MAKAKQSVTIDSDVQISNLNLRVTRYGKQSEIEAFIESSGRWVTIAEVYLVDDINAEDIADFFVRKAAEYRLNIPGK